MDPAPPPTTNSPQLPTAPETNKFDYWLKILVGLGILVIAINLSLMVLLPKFTKKSTPQTKPVTTTSVVSGTFDINGYIPPGATIEVQERQMGDQQFSTIAGPSLISDGNTWNWNTASEGTTYELQAIVISNNTPVLKSIILPVTAPATDETLRIVSSLAPPASATPPTNSSISGKIDLNGYIPYGATITIGAKKQGESQFTTVIPAFKANDGAAWSWNGAQSGIVYEIQATLLSGSITIGTSPSISTAAPAQNEILTINSKAPAPATKDTISGTFNINGVIPNGATITLSIRKSGTQQFIPVKTGIPPMDKSSWSYPDAQTGISYDILAYLTVNGTNYTQSQLLVVTAPAQNEVLTINNAAKPNTPPSSSMTFNCASKNSNNQWQVNIQYNQNNVNPNAQAFILRIGSSGGAWDMVNLQVAPPNPSQMQSYTTNFIFTEGQTYYGGYAYTTCQNCTDPMFYSQFSLPVQIRCVTSPSNTPSPMPTNSPTPTNTPIPTNTPTLAPSPTNTPTPKISQCNESCGSSGYQCVDGLTCITEGGAIGGQVCRNPSCTDESSCNCPSPPSN